MINRPAPWPKPPYVGRGAELHDCEGCGAPPELRATCSYCGRLRFNPVPASTGADQASRLVAMGLATCNEVRRTELLDVTTMVDTQARYLEAAVPDAPKSKVQR